MTTRPAGADDLSDEQFDRLVDTIFAPAPAAEGEQNWFWDDALDLEPEDLGLSPTGAVRFTRRLFEAPEILAERYDPDRIDQGFLMLYCAWGSTLFVDSLYEEGVSWEDRRTCIDAIPVLYRRLFVPMGDWSQHHGMSAPFMLPDFLAWPFDMETARRDDPDDRRVQEALVHAFRRLLRMDEPGAHFSAIHGIFHSKHPRGPALVRRFLRRPDVDPDVREYAESALARGRVL